MQPRIRIMVAAVVLTFGAAACSNSNTTTSPSTTAAVSTSPATMTFASQIGVGESAARTFTVKNAGTVNVTLVALSDSSRTIGLGIGLPATSAPCSLAQSTVAGPGTSPQLVVSADSGSYCVQVWDPGTLTQDTAFLLTVEHP